MNTLTIYVPTDTNGVKTRLSPVDVVRRLAAYLNGCTITHGMGYRQGTTERVYIIEHWSASKPGTLHRQGTIIAQSINRELNQYAASYKVNGIPHIVENSAK